MYRTEKFFKMPTEEGNKRREAAMAKYGQVLGEIFDDLDDDTDFQVGARVASAEITDMVRKSQIMDLNKSN